MNIVVTGATGVVGSAPTGMPADTGPAQIAAWDSLGQLARVQAVEVELGAVLELSEIFAIVTVGDLYDVLAARGLVA